MATVQKWSGREARALREALRMSVRGFAAYLGAGERTISKWEARGAGVCPRREMQAALDTALSRADDNATARFEAALQGESVDVPYQRDAIDAQVEIVPPEQAERAEAELPLDSMRRRTLVKFGLAATATAGLGAAGSGFTLDGVRQGLALAVAEEHASTSLDEWHEIVAEYGQTYMTTPAIELLEILSVDLLAIQYAMGRDDDAYREELCRTAATFAVLTALTLGNLGRLTEARRWWRSARQVADQSRDVNTAVWVRGYEVVRALYEERPTLAILRLTEEAEALGASATPAALQELLGGKAQTLAVLGRGNEAEAALCQLRDVLDAQPMTDDDRSLLSWHETELRFTEGFVYSYLGDVNKAEAAQTQALRLYPASNSRGPAQVALMRALCQVRSGDCKIGMQQAQHTMTRLSNADRIRPVVGLGHKVLDAVPQTDRDHPAVNEFRDYLAVATA